MEVPAHLLTYLPKVVGVVCTQGLADVLNHLVARMAQAVQALKSRGVLSKPGHRQASALKSLLGLCHPGNQVVEDVS